MPLDSVKYPKTFEIVARLQAPEKAEEKDVLAVLRIALRCLDVKSIKEVKS